MEFKYYIYVLSAFCLMTTALIYGVKLVKKNNYLLAFEWLVVAFSAANFTINAVTGNEIFLTISLFCDAFSRTAGIPIIAIAGLMVVTHGYKPSVMADVLYVVGALVATTIVWTADFMIEPKPYFYVVAWSIFAIYLAYFAKRLLSVGEKLNALRVVLALISSQTIASIYDFYHIPGDDDHVIFYTLALFTWSYLTVSIYYAYCSLERAQARQLHE